MTARGSARASTTGRGEEQLLPQMRWPNSLQQGICCTVAPEETRSERCRTDPVIHSGANSPHRHHVEVSLVDRPRLLENRSAQGKLDAQDAAVPGPGTRELGAAGQELKKENEQQEIKCLF